MKFLVLSFLLIAFAAFVQSAAAEEADHPLLVSELTGADVHLVTPEEMAALGFSDAARVLVCVASQCNSMCRRLGFRMGSCSSNAACVCFR